EGHRVPITDSHAYRELGVVWRPGQPVAATTRVFLDLLQRSSRQARGGEPSASTGGRPQAG
ncbi:MAG TPA: hypothetical protein VKF59_01680, partial [Candidatus Dormibacteraeota bacterium]|nr:hypothetical protein [Candidatus Dormibacteraeota bacterium]